MANTIITKNSATATAVPTAGQLVQGELAVNVTDKRLFTENSGGTVVEVGTNPSTIAVAGNATVGGTLGVTGLATLASSTLTANPTLSAGTANGVTYLNGSKVLTSGGGLTFDGTNLALTTTGAIYRVPTAGGSLFDASGNNGIYILGSSNYVATYAAGSERMRLTSTGLGIGTSSPATALDVSGNINVNGTGTSNFTSTATSPVQINGTSIPTLTINNSTTSVETQVRSTTTEGLIRTATNHPLLFGTSATEKMRLDTSGSLGLGVTPSAWFSVHKTFQLGGTFSGVTRAGALTSQSNDTVVQLFNNAYVNTSAVETYFADGEAAKYKQNRNSHEWHTAPSGTAGNAISFTQAMTLTAGGNLLVGATSSSYSAANRTVLALGSGSDGFLIDFQVSGETSDGYIYADGTNFTIENSNSGYIRFNTDASERARIDASGHLIVPNGITLGTAVGTYADANTLDDYEEGTWTPQITDATNNATMGASNSGTYTKIGRVVTCQMYVQVTSLGSVASSIYITGWPFTIGNNGGGSLSDASGLNITAGRVLTLRPWSGDLMRFYIWDATTGTSPLIASQWTASGAAFISATYTV
jgi:hypothetical protein